MSNIELSKGAEYLICSIYKEYKRQRENGVAKSYALFSGNAEQMHAIAPKMSIIDIDETCRELSRMDFLDCIYADDTVCDSQITDKAIVYMENRFKNKALDIFNIIANFIP
jgi:hypothetical protein